MNAFTIKDIENLSGVKAHTIRVWEQRYDFIKPHRTDTNIRFFTNEELKTILNIALLNKSGYKISHINKMTPEEIGSKIVSLKHPDAQQERLMNQLVGYMVDFDIDMFEAAVNNQLKYKDIDFFINEIIFPFLEKVGILWTTNQINPAQEHLVTNIIRQKLLVGIEKLTPQYTSGKTALLFLPEGEHHEIGLLYVFFLLKSRGIKVYYLGANMPLKDLEPLVKWKNPDYLYTHLTSLSNNFNMERFLTNIQQYIHGQPLYVSGTVTLSYKKAIPENVHFKKSLAEVKHFMEDLQEIAV